VELPPHSAHRGRDDGALLELAPGRLLDKAGRLDAENAWKSDFRRKALAREQLRPVEPKRFDSDQDLTMLWSRNLPRLKPQDLRAADLVNDCSFHGRHHASPYECRLEVAGGRRREFN
jgi:hypothetical protein